MSHCVRVMRFSSAADRLAFAVCMNARAACVRACVRKRSLISQGGFSLSSHTKGAYTCTTTQLPTQLPTKCSKRMHVCVAVCRQEIGGETQGAGHVIEPCGYIRWRRAARISHSTTGSGARCAPRALLARFRDTEKERKTEEEDERNITLAAREITNGRKVKEGER